MSSATEEGFCPACSHEKCNRCDVCPMCGDGVECIPEITPAMAAADDLLAACHAVIAVLDLGMQISASSDLAGGVRDAIAKATGGTT